MHVICHTNLDDYKTANWPTEMMNPRVGDRVEAGNGRQLTIHSITHCQDREGYVYLKIELYR